jgi:hypothetical protein
MTSIVFSAYSIVLHPFTLSGPALLTLPFGINGVGIPQDSMEHIFDPLCQSSAVLYVEKLGDLKTSNP